MNDSMTERSVESIDQGRARAGVPEDAVPIQAPDIFESADFQKPRVAGVPLPVGAGGNGRLPLPGLGDRPRRPAPAPEPKRALPSTAASAVTPSAHSSEHPSGLQRAVGALRKALPLVQRILPLLDGNVATTVSNILNPQPRPAPVPPSPPTLDLAPIETGLAELKTQQRDLRTQVAEQNSSLKRVEDQLQMVREATDRNTLEQQELLEDLKGIVDKAKIVAAVIIGLLAITVVLSLLLYMHIQKVLP